MYVVQFLLVKNLLPVHAWRYFYLHYLPQIYFSNNMFLILVCGFFFFKKKHIRDDTHLS